nr:MAG TPA: hypothetical protein [Bacteriophage sp.]
MWKTLKNLQKSIEKLLHFTNYLAIIKTVKKYLTSD